MEDLQIQIIFTQRNQYHAQIFVLCTVLTVHAISEGLIVSIL